MSGNNDLKNKIIKLRNVTFFLKNIHEIKEYFDVEFFKKIETIILYKIKVGNLVEAKKWMAGYDVLDKHGKVSESFFINSLFALKENQFELAENLLKEGFETSKSETTTHLAWSNELRFHCFFAFSEKLLKWSIKINPHNASLMMNYSNTLHEMHHTDQAIRFIKYAYELDPSNKEVLFYYKKGMIQEYLPDESEYIFDYKESATKISQSLENHGVAILKNIPHAETRELLLNRFIYNINNVYIENDDGKSECSDVSLPLHFLASHNYLEALKKCCIENRNKILGAWHWEFNKTVEIEDIWAFFESFDEVKVGISRFLGGDVRLRRETGYARRKSYEKNTLPMHQDARTGYWKGNKVVFWCPLVSCGKTSPAVEVIPWRFKSFFPLKLYSHKELQNRRYYSYHSSVNDALYPKEIVLSPILEPGDLLLFDTFTLHRTQLMNKFEREVRYNLDIRFELDEEI